MAKKQPNTDIKSDARDRLYRMITKAKPEILWQAESLRERWDRKKLERKGAKEIRVRLAYHWRNYKKLTAPQREALDNYITTQNRKITLTDLLWEQGYRHGDHVLMYDPMFGNFKQIIVTMYDAEGRVKPEDRTKRKSQPDLTRHETSWLINSK